MDNSDILLIQLRDQDDGQGDVQTIVYAPIGLAYIEAVLKDQGFTARTELLDSKDANAISTLIQSFRPKIVGISATGNEMDELRIVSSFLKRQWPTVPILVGGYASMKPEEILTATEADVVVLGEGEDTVRALVPAMLRGATLEDVAGIAYKSSTGSIVRTMTRPPVAFIDHLPVPVYRHYPPGADSVRVYASRGCPYQCTYCSIKDFYNTPKIRYHSAQYMHSVVSRLLEQSVCPVKLLFFNDDEFLLNPDHLTNMAGVARHYGLRICFQTRTQDVVKHATVISDNVDVIYQIHLGVESFSQAQLDRWKKQVSVATNIRALKTLADLGCSYYPYMILTDKDTTSDELRDSCDGLLSLPPCPFDLRCRFGAARGLISPLHAGMHFNRMKTFYGAVETAPNTAYLETVWRYLALTQEKTDYLCSLLRDALARQQLNIERELRQTLRDSQELIESRIRVLPELADMADGVVNRRQRDQIADDAARVFNSKAIDSVLGYMSVRLPESQVTV